MINTLRKILFFFFLSFQLIVLAQAKLQVGAAQTEKYIFLLKDKKVGMVVNQTSTINHTHLVDSLIDLKIDVQGIFSPEHGFRGNADAGEHVKSGVDQRTGVTIHSLYGNNKKPSSKQLSGINYMIFDIQDVGVRFYTYISTLHYIMEACAENNIPLLILDRPNPNGDYVAGPILDTVNYRSFVGMHPIPIVHGLTIGELAKMINGEQWLTKQQKCSLKIIPCVGYTHKTKYDLPIKPSPNLGSYNAIRLYPSLCLFEPTIVSVGRGTIQPFEVVGVPTKYEHKNLPYTFTPKSIPGMSKYPKYENNLCYGYEVAKTYPEMLNRFDPTLFMEIKKITGLNESDFVTSKSFLLKLVGNKTYYNYLMLGVTSSNDYAKFDQHLIRYKRMRKKYLLYPDFE